MARDDRRRGGGGRQIVSAALLLTVVLFFLPALVGRGEPVYQRTDVVELPNGESGLPIAPAPAPAGEGRDKGRTVRLLTKEGEVLELTMAEYLWGVVAAEMPAYVQRSAAEARWGLDAREYGEKIDRAVAGTDGLGILYDGKPIQALFFSSAAGRTVDAVEVWGNPVAYLKSVDSPEGEEVPNYRTQVVLGAEEVKSLTLNAYPGADLSGDRSARCSPCGLPASPWPGTAVSSPSM